MLAWGCNKDRDATSVCVCVLVYVIERKQKGFMRLKLEDELLDSINLKQLWAEMIDFFIWHLREWQMS